MKTRKRRKLCERKKVIRERIRITGREGCEGEEVRA